MGSQVNPRNRSGNVSRRGFILGACGAACGASLAGCQSGGGMRWAGGLSVPLGTKEQRIRAVGPGSRYTPTLQVAFVRRQGEYGMRWPGAVYDGEAALTNYRGQIEETATRLGMKATIRPVPLYSLAESEAWIAEASAAKPDGLLVVLLDRQEHAWPSAVKAIDTGLPTVVFAPVGAAFTTNTRGLADRKGCLICSTSDFSQAADGMKMIHTAARIREMRYVVLAGKQRRDSELRHFGTKLRHVPASEFLDEYNRTPDTDEIRLIASDYLRHARRIIPGPSEQDVINGVKSYVVARTILEREDGDAITMDCLGALGKTNVSLPCIAWSRMNDHGVPAACEADIGACLTHALSQYLLERPGFQQDPVPETAAGLLIGAHCSCPTRLNGFDAKAEPFDLSNHHGKRDAVPRTLWKLGQRATVACIIPSGDDQVRPRMVISAGQVVQNIDVPPAGGCVVSVSLRLDGTSDLLAYPGFHQLFLYGDHTKKLREYCRLFDINPVLA